MIIEQRIVIRDVTWHVYETLVDSIGEGQHVLVAYDGKDMEIMTTGFVHEQYKTLLGRFMNAVTMELNIPCRDAGGTTWKRPHVNRGVEADQSYYFVPDKRAAVQVASARRSNDINDYPDPDLAIEIAMSRSQVDRRGIYAAIKVPEIWRFDGETMLIERLGRDDSYAEANASRYFPIRSDEIARWITADDVTNQTAWERRLRAWIRTEVAAR
jgi:Uma2 family endonuclease